jgi:hypothetical protein
MNRLKNALKPTALLAAIILCFGAFAQGTVTIQSVDNYGGNSNVYTDAPNTDVTITELDADKKPVRSWTGKTDDKGKITIPAGSNLSKDYLKAERAKNMPDVLMPSSINANEPFTFCVSGVLEGQVCEMRSLSGEVISTPKADRLGRVFLPAGLAAGAYLLSTGSGKSHVIAPIHVNPTNPGNYSSTSVSPIANYTKLGDAISIHGTGLNPNAAALSGIWNSGAKTMPMNVLASSPNELILASPKAAGLKPGDLGSLTVSDGAASLACGSTTIYDAKATLTKRVMPSGSETHLLINVEPKSLTGNVYAEITSGPVTFDNGGAKTSAALDNGIADFRVISSPGSEGTFTLNWGIDWTKIADALNALTKDERPGTRRARHHIKNNDGSWTDEYDDYDAGNWIGSTSETYGPNNKMTSRKTVRNGKDGRTEKTEKWDKDGKWTETKDETFDKDGKQTGGTKTIPDGKGGTTTQTWDPTTGTYK